MVWSSLQIGLSQNKYDTGECQPSKSREKAQVVDTYVTTAISLKMSKILGDGSEFIALEYPGFSAQLKRKRNFMSKDEPANTNFANTCIKRCPSMSMKARQKAFRVRSGSKQVINMNPLTHNRWRHVYADAIFLFESGLGTASSHSLSLRYLRILSCCSVSSSPTFIRN